MIYNIQIQTGNYVLPKNNDTFNLKDLKEAEVLIENEKINIE